MQRINLFFFDKGAGELNIIENLEVVKALLGKCEARGSWFQTFEPCYSGFDDGLRLKFYKQNLILFLIFFTLIFIFYDSHREILKCLIIFPSLILFLSTSLHESNLAIILLFFLSLKGILLKTFIIFVLIYLREFEFIFPAILFLILSYAYNKKIIYGLITLALCIFSVLFLFEFLNIITEHREPQLYESNSLLKKIIVVLSSNNSIGEDNMIISRLIYSLTEIIGNIHASIMISSLLLMIPITYLFIKNFNLVIKKSEFCILISFIVLWDTTLWNYTDIRFYPFLVLLLIKLIIDFLDITKFKKILIFINILIPLEILIRSF